MKALKRWAALMLTAVALTGCFGLCVSAANAGLVTFSGSDETVLIRVFSGEGDNSDFVESYPKKLTLVEPDTDPPVEEPAVYIRWAYGDVPNFYGISYSDVLYGAGTVDTHGSGIVALAMTASYLTGYEYLPDELARCFAGKANEDVARITYGIKALGLPYEVSQKWEDTFAALQEGKLVILQMDATSLFTDNQHFIVLKGMTEDGKILINDPEAAHYLNEELEERFLTGFPVEDISTGARYAWIFDRDEVPADLARFEETVERTAKHRYTSLNLTPAQIQLLVRLVEAEYGYECAEGQQAAVEVILNRLLSGKYPETLKQMIYGDAGLTTAEKLNKAELTRWAYLAVERAIYGPYLLEKTVTEFSYECHE